jgi:hypothetical protein
MSRASTATLGSLVCRVDAGTFGLNRNLYGLAARLQSGCVRLPGLTASRAFGHALRMTCLYASRLHRNPGFRPRQAIASLRLQPQNLAFAALRAMCLYALGSGTLGGLCHASVSRCVCTSRAPPQPLWLSRGQAIARLPRAPTAT